MRLLELHIYGYGQFQQKEILLNSESVQVLFGKNEAGKSTVMSFIHSILFGFPGKQSADSKYEPMTGAGYGGAILAETEQLGRIRIERIPGKAGGEVTIHYGEGEKGGEELLKELTGGIDKQFYKAIFSFDVHGLQEVHQLKEEELGKYLYLTSMVGTDSLYQLENQLSKERERLFKPNGKKPLLNEELARTKDTYEQLKQAKQKNLEYEELKSIKEETGNVLERLQKERTQMIRQLQQAEKAQNVLPLLKEQSDCLNELEKLPDTKGFPVDGLARLEQLQSGLNPMKGQRKALLSQFERLTEQQRINKPDETILEKREAVEQLKLSLDSYEKTLFKLEKGRAELSLLQHEINNEKRNLSLINLDNREILSLETSFDVVSRLRESTEKKRQLTERKRLLDEQFDRSREALEESEGQINQYKKSLLQPEQRESLAKQAGLLSKKAASNEKEAEKAELKQLTDQIRIHEEAKKAGKSRMMLTVILLSLILLAGTGWATLNQQWILGGILTAACVLAIASFYLQQGKDPVMQHLVKRKGELEDELLKAQGQEESALFSKLEEVKGELWKDEQMRQLLETEKAQLLQKERAYDRILIQFEAWEKELFQLNEEGSNLASILGLDSAGVQNDLSAALEAIMKLKDKIVQYNQLQEKHQERLKEADRFTALLDQLKGLPINENLKVKDRIFEGYTLLNIERDKQLKWLQANDRLHELEEEIKNLTEKIDYQQGLIIDLLNKASVKEEEDFRNLAAVYTRRLSLQEKLNWVTKQLEEQTSGDDRQNLSLKDDYELKINELKDRIEQLEKEETEKQKERSQTIYHLQELEKNGTYSDLLHEYEQKKSIVRKLSRDWLVQSIARDYLQKTIEYHRSVRMPKLLKKAEELFSYLTNGNYQALYLPKEEQTFIAERKDGTRFQARQLSQATAEQLYISLRFALAVTINEKHGLPIMIDDGFVHFDEERTVQMIALLKKISADQQIIFFTCHRHLLSHFEKNEILTLTNRGSSLLYKEVLKGTGI